MGRSQDIEALLLRLTADVTGQASADLSPVVPFREQAVDSVRGVELLARAATALERPLPDTLLWEQPTPRQLAAFLAGGDPTLNPRAVDTPEPGDPIAVVGMACRLPGGVTSPQGFWELLIDGVDAITELPPHREGRSGGSRWGGFLDRVDQFDAAFFGISPREAEEMDPQQRLSLELAWEALEAAGIRPDSLLESSTGVYQGVSNCDYGILQRARGLGSAGPYTATGSAQSIVANRVSYALGLRGPSLAIDTACSSSLVAVHLACEALRSGECSLALAGGVSIILAPDTGISLSLAGALSADGRCKTFDARADGYVRGEGAATVVLKPLGRALRDGNPVLAVIRGSAVNNDGPSNGLTAPHPRAQRQMLAQAYARANVDPATVDYVEAHGTGTPLGDPIEIASLAAVCAADRPAEQPLWVGSVKTNIGHLEPASGVVGLVKTVLCMQHGVLPPSLHFHEPNPRLELHKVSVRVVDRVRPWPSHPGRPRRAGVSSFGIGGSNAHVVVEGHSSAPARSSGARSVSSPDLGAVFVSSGLGGQWLGMGRRMFETEPEFQRTLRDCDAFMASEYDHSVLDSMFSRDGAAMQADRPGTLAPVVVGVQIALAAWWVSKGVRPGAAIGHSVGEVVAAHVAGMLDRYDTLRVAVEMGLAVQRGVDRGDSALAIVEAEPEQIESRSGLRIAGFNGPRSVLVCGEADAIGALLQEWQQGGRFGRLLGPHRVHVADMVSLADAMAVADVVCTPPQIPLYSTTAGRFLEGAVPHSHWRDNLSKPVQFQQGIEALIGRGYRCLIELSPHAILKRPIEHQLTASGVQGTVLVSQSAGEDGTETAYAALEHAHSLGLVHPHPATPHLVAVSARSESGLRAAAKAVSVLLRTSETQLAEVAATCARRQPHPHRLVALGTTREDVSEALRAHVEGETHPDLIRGHAPAQTKLAFVFSGQGGQWAGMGRELLRTEVGFRRSIDRIDAAMGPVFGDSVAAYLRDDKALDLQRADQVQPVLFALQVALVELWRSWGIRPTAVVGQSMGEVAAAYVSGALGLNDACRVVCHRTQLTRQLQSGGSMCVVELGVEEVPASLEALGLKATIAAINGPRDLVLAGEAEEISALVEALEQRGVFARQVKVDYASHSAFMDPVLAQLAARLEGLQARVPTVPMVSTVSGEVLSTPPGPEYWVSNLRQPVRLLSAIQHLVQDGFSHFLEIGPHPLLAAAIASSAGQPVVVASSMRRDDGTRASCQRTAAELHVHGIDVNLADLQAAGAHVPLPAYPWDRRSYWLGQHGSGAGVPTEVQSGLSVSSDPSTHLHQIWAPTGLTFDRALRWLEAAALVRRGPGHVTLTGVIEHEPLPDDVVLVQIVSRGDDNTGPLELKLASRDGEEPWRIHLSAKASWHAAVDLPHPPPAPDNPLDGWSELDPAAAEASIAEWLQAQVADILGYRSAEPIDPAASLASLGFDSLMATLLSRRLEGALSRPISAALPLVHPTISDLAGHLIDASSYDPAEETLTQEIPRDLPGSAPLSLSQEGLWFLQQVKPHTTAYTISFAYRLDGRVDLEALGQALDWVVGRHTALRTAFVVHDGKPIQEVREVSSPVLTVRQTAQPLAEAMAAAASRPLALDQGRLFHAIAFHSPTEALTLQFITHHAIFDGWSWQIIAGELASAYVALIDGHPLPVLEPARPFSDFSRWQRQRFSEGPGPYWVDKLKGSPPLRLPTDRPRPAEQSFRGAQLPVRLPADLMARLTATSAAHDATLFMTLLSAFVVVLHQMSGQHDFCVGTPMANRDQSAWDALVGYVANTVAVRVDLTGNPSFSQLLERIRAGLVADYAHRDVPFDAVLKALSPPRDPSRSPVFQAMFVVQPGADPFSLPGVQAHRIDLSSGSARYEVHFELEPSAEGGMRGFVDYNTDLFDESTVVALIDDFSRLLNEVCKAVDAPLPVLARGLTYARLPVGIAATFTADPVAEPLRFWLSRLGLRPTVTLADYNQPFQALYAPSVLPAEAPGVSILLVRLEDWRGQEPGDSTHLLRTADEFVDAVRSRAHRGGALHLVALCPPSPAVRADDTALRLLHEAEDRIRSGLADHAGITLVVESERAATYPVEQVHHPAGDAFGHLPYTLDYFIGLGTLLARKISAAHRAPYKVLVLDCDNTLWGGVCGEVGPDGVTVDGPYRIVQARAAALHHAGWMVCLCSKNADEDVVSVFSTRDTALSLSQVAARRVNWQPKSANLRSLADELNVGLDSFVFVDDNPVEIAEVRANTPDVLAVQLPETPEEMGAFLDHVWAFDTSGAPTADDSLRTARMAEEGQRQAERVASPSMAEFLASLELVVHIAPMSPADVSRVSQLNLRTNQFNTTTIRRNEAEIRQLAKEPSLAILTVRVHDRFGDYGLVGAVFCREGAEALVVEAWLLSCRALGRGVEHQILRHLGEWAAVSGRQRVDVAFRPSAKNQPAANFLRSVAPVGPSRTETLVHIPASEARSASLSTEDDAAGEAPEPQQSRASTPRRRRPPPAPLQSSLRTVPAIRQAMAQQAPTRRDPVAPRVPFAPPGTQTESTIAAVFAEVLRLDRVGRDDNFFEIGGSSLLALQAQQLLEHRLGREVEVVSLFRSPTVRRLAAELEGEISTLARSDEAQTRAQSRRERLRKLRKKR